MSYCHRYIIVFLHLLKKAELRRLLHHELVSHMQHLIRSCNAIKTQEIWIQEGPLVVHASVLHIKIVYLVVRHVRIDSNRAAFPMLSGIRTLISKCVDGLSIVDWSRWDAGLVGLLLSQNWLQDTNVIDWLGLVSNETWLCNTGTTWHLVTSPGLYSIQ